MLVSHPVEQDISRHRTRKKSTRNQIFFPLEFPQKTQQMKCTKLCSLASIDPVGPPRFIAILGHEVFVTRPLVGGSRVLVLNERGERLREWSRTLADCHGLASAHDKLFVSSLGIHVFRPDGSRVAAWPQYRYASYLTVGENLVYFGLENVICACTHDGALQFTLNVTCRHLTLIGDELFAEVPGHHFGTWHVFAANDGTTLRTFSAAPGWVWTVGLWEDRLVFRSAYREFPRRRLFALDPDGTSQGEFDLPVSEIEGLASSAAGLLVATNDALCLVQLRTNFLGRTSASTPLRPSDPKRVD
jgi:hypothetical protein